MIGRNLESSKLEDILDYAEALHLLGTCYHEIDDHDTAYLGCLEALKVVQNELRRRNPDPALWNGETCYLGSLTRELCCLGSTEEASRWRTSFEIMKSILYQNCKKSFRNI